MLRSAQVGAGVAAGSMASFPAPALGLDESQHRALAPPGLPNPPLKADDYWRFVDWLAPYFDALWLEDRSYYSSGHSTVGRIYHNSCCSPRCRRRAGRSRRPVAKRRACPRTRTAPLPVAAME